MEINLVYKYYFHYINTLFNSIRLYIKQNNIETVDNDLMYNTLLKYIYNNSDYTKCIYHIGDITPIKENDFFKMDHIGNFEDIHRHYSEKYKHIGLLTTSNNTDFAMVLLHFLNEKELLYEESDQEEFVTQDDYFS